MDDTPQSPQAPRKQLTPNQQRFASHAVRFHTMLGGVDRVTDVLGVDETGAAVAKWAMVGFGIFLALQALTEGE